MFDLDKKEFFVSRDVKFFKDEYPFLSPADVNIDLNHLVPCDESTYPDFADDFVFNPLLRSSNQSINQPNHEPNSTNHPTNIPQPTSQPNTISSSHQLNHAPQSTNQPTNASLHSNQPTNMPEPTPPISSPHLTQPINPTFQRSNLPPIISDQPNFSHIALAQLLPHLLMLLR